VHPTVLLIVLLGVACIVLSGILFRKKHPFWLLALLMLNAGLFCVYFAIRDYYQDVFRFYYPYNSLFISLGLYLFFKNLHTSKLSKNDKRLLYLTLIESVIVIFLTVLNLVDPDYSMGLWKSLHNATYSLYPIYENEIPAIGRRIQMIAFFAFAFSFLVVLVKLFKVLKEAEAQHLSFFCSDSFLYYRWVRRFVLFCTIIGITAICIVISGVVRPVTFWVAFSLYFTMGIFGLGLLAIGIYTPLRYAKENDFKAFLDYIEKSNAPAVAHSIKSEPPAPSSTSKGLQLKLNTEKLITFLENERVFRDPNLSLASLAERLDTSPRSLSRTISEGCSMNFFELINSYRIKEVKDNLLNEDYQHYAILSIGMEAGFKSKSTFYDAFKKNTGMTPSQYKKSNS